MGKSESLAARVESLRGAGLRKTAPRLAVLEVLERARRPLSHAEVAESLAAEGLDRATVYRNLVALSEAGLVRRSDHGDHVWGFERVDAGHALTTIGDSIAPILSASIDPKPARKLGLSMPQIRGR